LSDIESVPTDRIRIGPNTIIEGDGIEVLKHIPDELVSGVLTDPPYGLSKQPDMREVLTHWLNEDDYEHRGGGFMDKQWDSFVPGPKIWEEVMRVIKPGAHILSFGGTRTYDLMVTAMRLAGAEVRDKIDVYCEQNDYKSWLYGSGFPKSLNIEKALEKKFKKAISDAGHDFSEWVESIENPTTVTLELCDRVFELQTDGQGNFIKPEIIDQYSGYGTALKPAHEPIICFSRAVDGEMLDPPTDEDGAPFKYTSKTAKKERNLGCENLFWEGVGKSEWNLVSKDRYDFMETENDVYDGVKLFTKHRLSHGNHHPTVKPLSLTRYLLKLIMPPDPDAIVLDPFVGSGTTACAAILEGYRYIGIDSDPNSVIIAKARTEYYTEHRDEILEKARVEEEKKQKKAEKAKD